MVKTTIHLTAVLGILTAGYVGSATAANATTAKEIYEATGVQGGLVVHLGCGDGTLTAALRAGDRYLVHGLDRDPEHVAQASRLLHARGLYGPVSVDVFDGRQLPYIDELVDLVVASEPGEVATDEILRVLVPEGMAYVRRGDVWQKIVKPRPADIDEWSHFLHDAGGNAVAEDSKVGPPKRLQWVAGPRWCRSHEFASSVNAVVTAGGRIFTIFDEGPTGIYEKMPQRCKLVARDAFNGVLLWKVPMRGWQPEFGTAPGARWGIHHTIPRRLIAEGDRVYVTLGFLDSPVSVLDAATGQILTEALEGTRGTDEMLLEDGRLIVKITEGRSAGATDRIGRDVPPDTLAAVDVETGQMLWRHDDRVVPYALSAQAGCVVYHNLEELVCLDAKTGDELWRTPNQLGSTQAGTSTLVIRDGVVLFHGRVRSSAGKKVRNQFVLTALSLDDGHVLWTHDGNKSLAAACTQPTDLFVADETVWCGNSLDGYDLRSGQVVQSLTLGELISPGHHYRCHRAKATERYLIWPKRGAEFIDLEGDDNMRNDWLRAPCFTGATPANGLFYAPSNQCFCYPGVKVAGYLAMSADVPEPLKPSTDAALRHGPAYGQQPDRREALPGDWPMYRHNNQRSGSTASAVPVELIRQWRVKLACRGTQPVVVGDKLWTAERDAHRIRCFEVSDGRELWSFIAGGRIDSSPTVSSGLVLFGCRDGSVYCLRADDGALVWQFRAAPDPRRLVAYEQLESVWPVQGSVLVQGGVVYFAAGRSSFLDGGILVYGLDVASGRVLYHHHLEGPWPDVSKDAGSPFAMEGALPDLLVSDGRDLYMERIKFDARLNRLETTQESPLGELDMGADHLVATGGFLDDTGFDRVYWMYSRRWPGFYFAQQSPKAGQLVVFDDTTTYAVKYFYRRFMWSPLFVPGEQGYLLFADDNGNEPMLEEPDSPFTPVQWLPKETLTDQHRRGGRGVEKGTGYVRSQPAKWQKMVPLRIRAMVLAGNRLFTAGLPDVVDPDDPTASLEGRRGALLQVFSTADGSLLESYPLDAVPAFDGMSAAGGRLYLATLDGHVIAFGARVE